MVGTELGHYAIVEKLGHGGMGEVYRAHDRQLKRQVAIKVLSGALTADEERMARFRREAETVAALNHPNIVTIYSIGEEDGLHFLTMELVEGKTLDQLIPPSGLPLKRVFELAIPLADALSAAHERGIVHRDLKPANVMVTGEGRVKVLDFGLAKLQEDAGEGAEEGATEALTREGLVMGTVPYMSPEQVRGEPADRRSDIFSLGVILYEMAVGRRPFSGGSSAELISSILRDSPLPVTELKAELPHHLGRIIRHCLEKEPQRRYQAALDVRNELKSLEEEVDSGTIVGETAALPSGPQPVLTPGSRRWLVLAGGAALALALAFVGWQVASRRAEEPVVLPATLPAAAEKERPSVAVLFFDNLSGDEELDWLRSGLTDMLVTDLSQSPDLRVLSTDRLYQILSDMRKLDERITSFEVVNKVAERSGAGKVVLGTFTKLGETIRISIRIRDVARNEDLAARSVDARLEEELFSRVDELSRSIRGSIELPERPIAVADRDLEEVTTASVAAYRAYVQAEELHYKSRELEAIELYKRAVEEDPAFAMAWAKLATAYGNLQMAEQARSYAEKAMEHLDRLTEPERAYVEGRYFGQRLETIGRAIDTYRQTLERYPHLTALANNLGLLYSSVWMVDEAISVLEQAIRYGDDFPGTHHALAAAYASRGDMDRGLELLRTYLGEHPKSFSTHQVLAGLLAASGDLDAAEASLARAAELQPEWIGVLLSGYLIDILKDDLAAARRRAEKVGELPFPFAVALESGFEANLLLHRGRGEPAVELARKAIASWPGPGPSRAANKLQLGIFYLLIDQPREAFVPLEEARAEDREEITDYVAQALLAVAQQQVGQERRAELAVAELARRVEGIPGPVGDFVLAETRGHIALARGRPGEAVRELERAAELLPELDGNLPRVQYALAEACLAAGRTAQAERVLRELVADEGGLRALQPIAWVRAHYQLGRVLEGSGDVEGAARFYREFVERWGDGDLDRQAVAHARAFLAAAAAAG